MNKHPELQPHSKTGYGVKKSQTQEKALIDRLMDFERPRIQSFLKDTSLPSSGSKEDLRYFIEQGIKTGSVSPTFIEKKILEWEPWTHRHYYFVKIPKEKIPKLADPQFLATALTEAGVKNRIEAALKFYIPGTLKIDRVVHQDGKLFITFVAPLYTYERRQAEDKFDEHSDMVYEAKQRKISRKVYVLELNVRSGQGFLSIPAVHRGKTYGGEFAAIEKLVRTVIGIDSLDIIPISVAVEKLMAVEQAISNSLQVKFSSGHKVSIKSPKKASAVFDDKKMKRIEKIAKDGYYAEGAFYYTDEQDKPDFRFKIHNDHRLGIFTDLEESETRDVLELVLRNL